MKKTVEVTYCDRCSTAIDPDELKVCAGFDLCQPCAAELQIRIKAFVEELKTPERPGTEDTVEPAENPPAEPIPVSEPPIQHETVPEKYGGFLHLKCSGCGATKTFCAKKPMITAY